VIADRPCRGYEIAAQNGIARSLHLRRPEGAPFDRITFTRNTEYCADGIKSVSPEHARSGDVVLDSALGAADTLVYFRETVKRTLIVYVMETRYG